MENIEQIKTIINKLMICNNRNIMPSVDIDNIYYGEIVEKDGAIGCIEGQDGWYLYNFFDHTEACFIGPFSERGIVKALSTRLCIGNNIESLKFTKEEEKVYFYNHMSYDDFWENKKKNR